MTRWEEREYNADSKVTKYIEHDADGIETEWAWYEYDESGRLTRIKKNFITESGEWVNEHTYGDEGHILYIYAVDGYDSRTVTYYDEAGRMWKYVAYENGEVHHWNEYEYDSEGNRIKTIQHNADGSVYEY